MMSELPLSSRCVTMKMTVILTFALGAQKNRLSIDYMLGSDLDPTGTFFSKIKSADILGPSSYLYKNTSLVRGKEH